MGAMVWKDLEINNEHGKTSSAQPAISTKLNNNTRVECLKSWKVPRSFYFPEEFGKKKLINC